MNDVQPIQEVQELFAQTVALFHRLREVGLDLHQDLGVTPGMRGVMLSLDRLGPRTVPQLARQRPVSRQHIQNVVNRLRAANLVRTEDNPDHKRSRLIVLTDKGRQTLADMLAREERLLAAQTPGLDPDRIREASRTLAAIREALAGRPGKNTD
jgi:DNA-binding MarR family transcriptional regulator